MGCGSSAAAKAAPYLAQYFGCGQKMMDAVGNMNPLDMIMDPKKMQEVARKTEVFKDECKVLAGQSFDHHDKDASGSLDVAEAKIFFQNYVTLFLEFHEKNDVKMLKRQLAMQVKMMGGMMDMMGPDAKKQMKEQEKEVIEQLQDSLKAKRTFYTENKVSCDAKSFAFLDQTKDGKVYKKDVVDALTMDTEMYNNVHCALGLMDEAEAEMKNMAAQMGGAVGGDAAGCAQQ